LKNSLGKKKKRLGKRGVARLLNASSPATAARNEKQTGRKKVFDNDPNAE
jgi:hypothetical protein